MFPLTICVGFMQTSQMFPHVLWLCYLRLTHQMAAWFASETSTGPLHNMITRHLLVLGSQCGLLYHHNREHHRYLNNYIAFII